MQNVGLRRTSRVNRDTRLIPLLGIWLNRKIWAGPYWTFLAGKRERTIWIWSFPTCMVRSDIIDTKE